MEVPLFDYSIELNKDPQLSSLGATPNSMWALHRSFFHFKNLSSLNADHFEAMANFKCWQNSFGKNCCDILEKYGDDIEKLQKDTCNENIIQCMFFAELQEWKLFLKPELLDDSSFFSLSNGRLVYNRSLSCLLIPKRSVNLNTYQ